MFISDEFQQIVEQEALSPEELWAIENEYEFVSNMSMYIAEKCGYGSNLDALSHEEQVFYFTQTLEMEVNCGGFWQFLFNADEDVLVNAASALSEIGAEKTATICKNAFSAFEEEIPTGRAARMLFLSKIGMEECYEILSEFDEAFFAYEEDLNSLNYAYVHTNKESFD